MRVFERTTTREQFSDEKEWQTGYVFASIDISDILVCEVAADGDIGRMHLRSACKELKSEDAGYFAALSAAISKKFPKVMKILHDSELNEKMQISA